MRKNYLSMGIVNAFGVIRRSEKRWEITQEENLMAYMKKTIVLLLAFVSLASLHAQGTLQFTVSLNGGNEMLPNSSPYTASGTLTLNGNTLNYSIGRNGWDFLPLSAG